MKLSIESFVPYKYFGDREGLRLIRDAGFDAVDYSMYFLHEVDNMLAGDGYRDRAKTVRGYLDELGLTCNQAHGPFTIRVDAVLDESNPAFIEVVRSMEFASILGAPHIVLHGLIGSADPTSQEYEDLNVTYFKKLEPYCEKFGIKIAIENLMSAGCKTPELHSTMLRRLGTAHFTGLIDVGHANYAGYRPADFLRACDRGTIHGLHIHDNHGTSDEHLNPFCGSIDWTETMHALAEIGYDGDLTLEDIRFMRSYAPHMLPQALRFAAETGRYLMSLIR